MRILDLKSFKYLIFILLNSFLFGQEFDCPSKKGILLSDYKQGSFHCCVVSCTHKLQKNVVSKKNEVYAIEDGFVASVFSSNGTIVLIKNDINYIAYANLENILVKKDEKIKKGDLIAYSNKVEKDFLNNEYKNYYEVQIQYWEETSNITDKILLKCKEKLLPQPKF